MKTSDYAFWYDSKSTLFVPSRKCAYEFLEPSILDEERHIIIHNADSNAYWDWEYEDGMPVEKGPRDQCFTPSHEQCLLSEGNVCPFLDQPCFTRFVKFELPGIFSQRDALDRYLYINNRYGVWNIIERA